jgi:heme oxygenase
VTGVGAEATAIGQGAGTLRMRLRIETASWHDRVEAMADIPASIRTRGEYIDLLSSLYELHSSLESELATSSFHDAWQSVGVDVSAHRRAHLLAVDLRELKTTTPRSIASVPFATFGHALGCLYVLEGSSLGGRTIAQLVRDTLGEVPTTFFSGDSRSRPSPWVAMLGALTRFETRGGNGDAVVSGACDIFATFAERLGRGKASQTTVAPT